MNRSQLALLCGALMTWMVPGLVSGAELGSLHVAPPRTAIERVQFVGPSPYGPDGGYGPPPGYGQPDQGGPNRGRMRGAEPGGPVQRVTYHGFRIDLSAGGISPNVANDVASVEHQIDIVDSVGLTMSELQLFRSFPIRVVDGMGGGGHFSGGSTVTLGNLLVTDNRPVLLHEYMHVFHFRHLPGGFRNPEIRRFYEEAQASQLYEPGAYMMTNPGEFFAVTASCYLYGTVAREPYNRETIAQRQPDYYAYLERLLGAPHGSHSAASLDPRYRIPHPSRQRAGDLPLAA